MYGLISKIVAVDGERENLALLLTAGDSMPGCRSYVVANDATDGTALWVTEVWDSREAHTASLDLPNVRAAIAAARPLIAGFSDRIETEPLGGIGIS